MSLLSGNKEPLPAPTSAVATPVGFDAVSPIGLPHEAHREATPVQQPIQARKEPAVSPEDTKQGATTTAQAKKRRNNKKAKGDAAAALAEVIQLAAVQPVPAMPVRTVGSAVADSDPEAAKSRKKKTKKLRGQLASLAAEHPWIEDVDGRPAIVATGTGTSGTGDGTADVSAPLAAEADKSPDPAHAAATHTASWDVDLNPKLPKLIRDAITAPSSPASALESVKAIVRLLDPSGSTSVPALSSQSSGSLQALSSLQSKGAAHRPVCLLMHVL